MIIVGGDSKNKICVATHTHTQARARELDFNTRIRARNQASTEARKSRGILKLY